MQRQEDHSSGWDFVASSEAAAELIAVALDLDPDEPVTRSELTGMAEVTLKRLYLDETISKLADAGVFEQANGHTEGEVQYVVNEDSDVLAAAAQFDQTLSNQLTD